MTKGKILAAVPEQLTINGEARTKYHVTVLEGNEAKIYDAWSKRITEKINQEIEYEVKPPRDPKYPATLVLPKEGGGGGNWQPKGDPKLTAKTMCLAYAKDLIVAVVNHHPDMAKNANVVSAATLAIYRQFITEVMKEELPKLPQPASQPATSEVGASEIPF